MKSDPQKKSAILGPPVDEGVPVLNTASKGVRGLGLFFFLFLFVIIGGWFWLASIAGAVVASGAVGVTGKPKTIQHLDGGVVAEIKVDNGDMVAQGDLLVLLDETVLRSNLDIYKNRLRQAVSRRDRLLAERDNLRNIRWEDDIFDRLEIKPTTEFRESQSNLRQARRLSTRGQVNQLDEKTHQFENQIKGLEALKASKITQSRLLEGELVNMRALREEGYASDNRVLTLERQVEEFTGQVAEHNAEISRVRNSISETQIQVSQIDREFNQSVQTELGEVELSIKDMEQQIIATQQQLSRVEIRAPVSGVVHELGIFTIGGVVPPGGAVMQLIPQNQKMEFEVNIEPQFVDQVYPGQDARVMFSAFNTRTTPELNGTVSRISPNTIVNEEAGMAFYLVNVTVSESELARLNGQVLVPGMPVEVFITTESRSPLNYIVKPLTDNFRRSLREE